MRRGFESHLGKTHFSHVRTPTQTRLNHYCHHERLVTCFTCKPRYISMNSDMLSQVSLASLTLCRMLYIKTAFVQYEFEYA